MTILKKITAALLAMCLSVSALAMVGCDNEAKDPSGKDPSGPTQPVDPNPGGEDKPVVEEKDYAAELKLDMTSTTVKQEVTVKTFVDGDTTHFLPKKNSSITASHDFSDTEGLIKARYLAINTPESTGKIEEWGKAASRFTKGKLSTAKSIIVESDDDKWNIDSTGSRYLLWVWYMPEDGTEYKNLNIEILQNGLAVASSTANNRYGTTGMAALNQAKALKLNIYSGKQDPDFYYGDAVPITLKELRCHIAEYTGIAVSFEAGVVGINNNTAYVEEYDEESGVYFGMSVYYGFSTIPALEMGNRVRVVGTVQYYEAGGTYQVSGITYRPMRPDDPTNTILLSEGYTPSFQEVNAKDLLTGNLSVTFVSENEEGEATTKTVTIKQGDAMLGATVSLKNLKVLRTSTTSNGGNNDGAITLYCRAEDGTEITVRTGVLRDNGTLVTASRFEGKTIDVKGVVDYFNVTNQYQIFSYRLDHFTFVD